MAQNTKPVLLSWSSGKDSAWALHVLNQSIQYNVVGLFTTINEQFDRVAMHAVRRSLLEKQAQAARLPLHIINIPYPCSNEIYAERMTRFIESVKTMNVAHFAFGDLFLDSVRQYREHQLAPTGIEPLFPLWGTRTHELAIKMIDAGVKAKITCVDPNRIDASFAGSEYDFAFVRSLPEHVDPCGENGEFHTFVYDGPMFASPLSIEKGEIVHRDGFFFCDFL